MDKMYLVVDEYKGNQTYSLYLDLDDAVTFAKEIVETNYLGQDITTHEPSDDIKFMVYGEEPSWMVLVEELTVMVPV